MNPRQEGWSPRMMAHPVESTIVPDGPSSPVEGRSLRIWVPGWIRDLIDRWRHPGESVPMRRYRRWRDGTGRGPYILSTVREISVDPDPFGEMGRLLAEALDGAESVEEVSRIRIVGARMIYGSRDGLIE